MLHYQVAIAVLVTTILFGASYKPQIRHRPISVQDIVQAKGYPCEEHIVTTKDGFLLPMQRLPVFGGSPVVLQHGLLEQSSSFVMNDVDNSLPFILHDLGYDVYLSNTRAVAIGHKHLRKSNPQYYEWTVDELARFDLTAIVDYVLNKSHSTSLAYIGHSQGSLMAFAGLSSNSSVHQHLKSQIHLLVAIAPMGNFAKESFTHVIGSTLLNGMLELLRTTCGFIGREYCMNVALFDFIRSYIFQPNTNWFCGDAHGCGPILTFLAGGSSSNFDPKSLVHVFDRYPFESSLKNLVHLSQMDSSGLFQMFDYGTHGNVAKYGQQEVPAYQVDVGIPTAVYYGEDDRMALPHRSRNLVQIINHSNYLVDAESFPDFGHSDFCWGLSKQEVLYPRIIKQLEHFRGNLPTSTAECSPL